MVVPGSVRSAASAGTNQLLAHGAAPVRDAKDVLVALGRAASAIATGGSAATAGEPPLRGTGECGI
jgi:predicted Rossmann fold nucleotide-binding protein DprA/Smf involved in DNA uptake